MFWGYFFFHFKIIHFLEDFDEKKLRNTFLIWNELKKNENQDSLLFFITFLLKKEKKIS